MKKYLLASAAIVLASAFFGAVPKAKAAGKDAIFYTDGAGNACVTSLSPDKLVLCLLGTPDPNLKGGSVFLCDGNKFSDHIEISTIDGFVSLAFGSALPGSNAPCPTKLGGDQHVVDEAACTSAGKGICDISTFFNKKGQTVTVQVISQ